MFPHCSSIMSLFSKISFKDSQLNKLHERNENSSDHVTLRHSDMDGTACSWWLCLQQTKAILLGIIYIQELYSYCGVYVRVDGWGHLVERCTAMWHMSFPCLALCTTYPVLVILHFQVHTSRRFSYPHHSSASPHFPFSRAIANIDSWHTESVVIYNRNANFGLTMPPLDLENGLGIFMHWYLGKIPNTKINN
jgi:hypothetical protein